MATELPLFGAGGEPVDFARTIVSHGVTELPPNRVDLAGRALETTLPATRGAPTIRITAASPSAMESCESRAAQTRS